jgi:small nuclear ribonucleoprotein D3
MNVRLDDVNITSRDGKLSHLEQVYLRGAQIRYIIIPDMLKNAPMFKKIKNQTKAAKQAMIARGKVRGRGAQAFSSRGKQIVASVNL